MKTISRTLIAALLSGALWSPPSAAENPPTAPSAPSIISPSASRPHRTVSIDDVLGWTALRRRGLKIDSSFFNVAAVMPRTRSIDMIVLHTTESRGAYERNILPEISKKWHAHYVIGRTGTVYPLVDPEYWAWHADQSMWSGVCDLDKNSIGIEFVANALAEQPALRREVTDAQYAAGKVLKSYLMERYRIPPDKILGHTQVALNYANDTRGRKGDPGPAFSYKKLGLPNNYALSDPDICAGLVRWNGHALREHRLTPGQLESFLRVELRAARRYYSSHRPLAPIRTGAHPPA